MTCPTCGARGAYVGFTEVECPNARCAHYKPSESGGVTWFPRLRIVEIRDGVVVVECVEDV